MSKGGCILGIDVGNTNTVFGLFLPDESDQILYHWRTATNLDRTSDELGIFLLGFLNAQGLGAVDVDGFIYSSVVPPFNPILERMARSYFRSAPLQIRHDIDLPLRIAGPHPHELGADRLVNAAAAKEIYGGDLIVVDMGTATTFCVIHDDLYRGGSIAPGLKLSMDALMSKTAQLSSFEFGRPASGVVGDTTIHALQSGFFFGWSGLLRGIIDSIRQAEPARRYRVVATGGLASLIQRELPGFFDILDPILTLRGLKIIYRLALPLRK